MIKVTTVAAAVLVVIGLWSCQLCYGAEEPSGHVNAKTTAPEQEQQPPSLSSPATRTSQDATAASPDTLPTAAAAVAASSRTDNVEEPLLMSPQEQQQYPDGSNKYSYTIGDDDQMSMFPEALEDTTQDQRIYVTLPESKPLHVPYTAQHRFGPVLRNPQQPSQEAKKFDENIILLEENKGPSESPYDIILKPLFISPDLIQIPIEQDSKNEQIISPTNNPDNPSGNLSDLQKLFDYTRSVVNDNDVLVINDAADATANVRNFTNFEGQNEIDQMAVESAADRNMTMVMKESVAEEEAPGARIGRSGIVVAATGNLGESIDSDDSDDEREGAESKIRYSRFRKINPIVVKAAEDEDCDDEETHNQPEAQQLIKSSPTRDYLPSKINVEILDDHNNGQFLKETVFIAAAVPKTELEAPSRQFLKTYTGQTLSPDTSTITTNYKTIIHTTPLPPPIPIGLRLTPPKTTDEDCDEPPPPPTFKGKTIVEVQKSVSVTERRVTNNPQSFRSGSRFSNHHQPSSKCLNDCFTPAPSPHPPAPIYLPSPPQQIIVEKPVVVDRVVEKPVQVTVEKIVNRPYPVDRIVEKPVTVFKSVPVPVDRIVEKQVTKYVDRPYPVERIVEKQVPYPVERVVEKLVPQPYPVEKQVTVERIVDRPVEVQVPVTQVVEKIVDRPVEVERIVEKQVPVPYPVEVNKYIDRPYPVEKIVERPVHIPVPVETVVEKFIDRPVETLVETPVAVEVPVPHHIHHHHLHNPHPHEHLHQHHLHAHLQHPQHFVKHVHLEPSPLPAGHFEYAKSVESTLLKPVHKLLGNLWNKLQSPFFGNHHHHHTQTKHVTLPLYKTKYHSSDNNLYAGSYGYVADSLPGGSLYNGVAYKESNNYYGPVPLTKYEPYWSYGRANYVAPPLPVSNTIHLTPNRYNYRRHLNFLKNIRWEYGGFKPPLIPSVEIDEFGNPIHRELDSRR